MFTIAAEANGESLQVPGDVELDIPSELVGAEADENGVSPVKLWSINAETGRWVYEADLIQANDTDSGRKRRRTPRFRTVLKGIPIRQTWYNFDVISRRTCYSKVRVFGAGSLQQVPYAKVGVIVSSGFQQSSVSYVRAYTDLGDINGYCVAHPCDNEIRTPGSGSENTTGIIFAQAFGEDARPLSKSEVRWRESTLVDELEYESDNDTIQVKLNLRPNDTMGPFYSAGTKLL